jgi:dTDP-4-dehydrorhamnose 3,5-epimerase
MRMESCFSSANPQSRSSGCPRRLGLSKIKRRVKTVSTKIAGVLLLQPTVHRDARGYFLESWNRRAFADHVLANDFVQDNRSHSAKSVLRGLHFQAEPMSQGKLVGVAHGRIYDVVADLRKSSPTFGRTYGCYLDASEGSEIWIPPGLAHGFLVVSDEADVWYKTTQFYSPEHERCIRWDDPDLAIGWPLEGASPIVSEKDSRGGTFATAEHFA